MSSAIIVSKSSLRQNDALTKVFEGKIARGIQRWSSSEPERPFCIEAACPKTEILRDLRFPVSDIRSTWRCPPYSYFWLLTPIPIHVHDSGNSTRRFYSPSSCTTTVHAIQIRDYRQQARQTEIAGRSICSLFTGICQIPSKARTVSMATNHLTPTHKITHTREHTY